MNKTQAGSIGTGSIGRRSRQVIKVLAEILVILACLRIRGVI